ncbi:MAG TPA: hypothetical protein VFI41_05090 [Gemmatimonadales bacterium]|nr:hypothetical protein [Gemmatimonadales bacterium]
MVSRRRLPPANGNGHSNGASAVIPTLRKGDRARRLPAGPIGIVLKTEKHRALMHWGTTSFPGAHGLVENRIEEWVPKIELERVAERIVTDEEIAQRQQRRALGAS